MCDILLGKLKLKKKKNHINFDKEWDFPIREQQQSGNRIYN